MKKYYLININNEIVDKADKPVPVQNTLFWAVCEQDIDILNYIFESDYFKEIKLAPKQLVSQKIKAKAKELRDANEDSELLIVSEMLQVKEGLITGEKAQEIRDRFKELSDYKNKVIEEYQRDKSKKEEIISCTVINNEELLKIIKQNKDKDLEQEKSSNIESEPLETVVECANTTILESLEKED